MTLPSRPIFRMLLLSLVGCLSASQLYADYRAKGTFLYEDREFGLGGFAETPTPRPIRFAEVRIMAGSHTLAKGATDNLGEFSIAVPGSVPQSIAAICVARSETAPGPLLSVRVAQDDYGFGEYYSVASTPVAASGAGTLDIGTTTATAETDAGKAFNIWDVLIDGLEFVASPLANGSMPAEPLTVIWRADHIRSGSYFSTGRGKYIYMGNRAGYDDTVISHELGHFIENLFSKSDSPGGVHYIGDGKQDIRLSWSEGLATFLGSWMRKFHGYPQPDIYVATDGSRVSFSYQLETLDGNVNMASKTGSTNEAAVSAVLWDLIDGPNIRNGYPETDDDPMERPFSDVWEVLTRYFPSVKAPGLSVEDFWDGWFSSDLNKGSLSEMREVFAFVNGMEFLPDPLEGDDDAQQAGRLGHGLIPRRTLGPSVQINELDMGRIDAIELYNAGSQEVDLTGWQVEGIAPEYDTVLFSLPAFRLAPGAFVILFETSGRDTATTLYFGTNISWANGTEGACILRDAGGKAVDFVRWGGSVEPVPGGLAFSGANPASAPAGKNLARSLDSGDAGRAENWKPQSATLGSYNSGGREIHHTFYPSDDADATGFTAAAGTEYLIETLNPAGGAQPLVEILARDGATILKSSDPSSAASGSQLRWTAPETGRFFARIRRSAAMLNYAEYGSYDFRILARRPITVSLDGSADFAALGDAIAGASAGDMIEILDSGTYAENLVIASNVTLRAAAGQAPEIAGNAALGPTVRVEGASTRLEAMRIRGGSPAVLISRGKAELINSTIFQAAGSAEASDGLRVSGPESSVSLMNSAVATNPGVGVAVDGGASARIVNSIIHGNLRGDVLLDGPTSTVSAKNSMFGTRGSAPAGGNIEGDPKFADPSAGNFHLLPSSPALDRGDAADPDLPQADAEGLPRSLDGNRDGAAIPDLGPYEYVPTEALAGSSTSPQVALGGAYKTTLVALNTDAKDSVVQITLRDSFGAPIGTNAPGRPDAAPVIPFASLGAAELAPAGSAATLTGYATLSSEHVPDGSTLFRTLDAEGRVLGEAAVGLARPATRLTLYLDNRNGAFSGYAVANPSAAPAAVDMVLRTADGRVLEQKRLTLAGGKQIAEFAAERFPANAPAGFEGSLELASDVSVSAVALRYDNPGQDVFLTIPVVSEDRTSTLLYLPQLADGGSYRTSVVLMNPLDLPCAARVEFLDSAGKPLGVQVEGSAQSTRDLALGARAVASFTTDGASSNIRTGWIRVSSTRPIGAAVIFQTRSGGRVQSQAGVGWSPASRRVAVRVDSREYTESGLALCNPNPAATTVQMRLRDRAGLVVAAESFTLPANGHTARFYTQWFAQGFSSFDGVLEVNASEPVAAVALRYDNAAADVFSTIPAIPIP